MEVDADATDAEMTVKTKCGRRLLIECKVFIICRDRALSKRTPCMDWFCHNSATISQTACTHKTVGAADEQLVKVVRDAK